MLTFQFDGKILEVREAVMSARDTRVSYWYYDIEKWMKSSHGKQGDTPDRVMTEDDIKWVKDHYLPNVLESQSDGSPQSQRSAFDPKAKARFAQVTSSMERDNFYEDRTREECAIEWRRRYDELAAADREKAAGPSI